MRLSQNQLVPTNFMPELMRQPITQQPLRVTYAPLSTLISLPEDTLAAIAFGDDSPLLRDARYLRIGLPPLHGGDLVELWRGNGPITRGRHGIIRYCHDSQYLFGVIELEEGQFDDIRAATCAAYTAILAFQQEAALPYLLRMWNYFDAITAGEGDNERYKRFCLGRAEGLNTRPLPSLPAATAIGRRDGNRILQIYWLASTTPGHSIENPRQISAFHYPRQYGPAPPRFARGMLTVAHDLLISGTASIVGHATHHDGDVVQQYRETFANIGALLHQAHLYDSYLPATPGSGTLLKVYLRHEADAATIHSQLEEYLPSDTPFLILSADICRPDLLIEIDGLHRRS